MISKQDIAAPTFESLHTIQISVLEHEKANPSEDTPELRKAILDAYLFPRRISHNAGIRLASCDKANLCCVLDNFLPLKERYAETLRELRFNDKA